MKIYFAKNNVYLATHSTIDYLTISGSFKSYDVWWNVFI